MDWQIIALILGLTIVFVLYVVAIRRNARLQKEIDGMFPKNDGDSEPDPIEHQSKELNDWYISFIPKDNYNGGKQ